MPTTMPTDIESLRQAAEAFWSLAGWTIGSIGVGLAVVGMALLLWGRVLHRAVLVVVAIPVGMALGGMLTEHIDVTSWQWKLATSLAVAVALAVLAMVLARIVWAVLASMTVGAVAAAVIGLFLLGNALVGPQPEGWEPTTQDFAEAVWAVGSLAMSHAFVGAAVGGFVLALFLPRATVIAVTSLLGASLLANSLALLAATFAPSLLAPLAAHQGVTTGAFFAVVAAGILYQSVKEVRARRSEADAEGDAEPAAPAGKGRRA